MAAPAAAAPAPEQKVDEMEEMPPLEPANPLNVPVDPQMVGEEGLPGPPNSEEDEEGDEEEGGVRGVVAQLRRQHMDEWAEQIKERWATIFEGSRPEPNTIQEAEADIEAYEEMINAATQEYEPYITDDDE